MNVRQQIIKDSSRYLIATIAGQGIGLIRAILLPILFTPPQLGIWNLMNVVLGYGANAHVGLLDGMNKAIPFFRGRNEPEQIERIKDSVFWMNLLLGGFAGVILWSVSWLAPAAYGIGLRITAGVLCLQLIFYYFFSLLRADNRFGLLSGGIFRLSMVSTALILAGALVFQDRLRGALIGFLTSYAFIIVYWLAKSRYRFVFQCRFDAIRKALKLGIPLIVLGILNTVFMSIDRWMIAAWLDETRLGYYALGFMASNMLVLVPASVASVLYPRMLERFAVNRDPRSAQSLLTGPMRALAALMLILIGAAVVVLPLLIILFLPKYLPSVPALMVLIPGVFFLSLAPLAANYLIAIDRQRLIIIAQVVMTLLCLGVDHVVLTTGYGIVGVAVVTAVGYSMLGLSYILTALIQAKGQKRKALLFLTRIFFPFVVMILVITAMPWVAPEGAGWLDNVVAAAVRLVLLMLSLALALWLANRDGELLAVVRSEWKRRFGA